MNNSKFNGFNPNSDECNDGCDSTGMSFELNGDVESCEVSSASSDISGILWPIRDTEQWICTLETVDATPPDLGVPFHAVSAVHPSYGAQPTRIYSSFDVDGSGTFTFISTAHLWRNTNLDITDGPVNYCSIWADNNNDGTPDAVANEWIGFVFPITVDETTPVYVGIAGDNRVRIKLTNALVTDHLVVNLLGNPVINFQSWHIYPVTFTQGLNYLTLEGNDDGFVSAAFGAEVYNNTEAEIIAATTRADLDVLFTTRDVRGQLFHTGGEGGYSCPEGYTFDPNLVACVLYNCGLVSTHDQFAVCAPCDEYQLSLSQSGQANAVDPDTAVRTIDTTQPIDVRDEFYEVNGGEVFVHELISTTFTNTFTDGDPLGIPMTVKYWSGNVLNEQDIYPQETFVLSVNRFSFIQVEYGVHWPDISRNVEFEGYDVLDSNSPVKLYTPTFAYFDGIADGWPTFIIWLHDVVLTNPTPVFNLQASSEVMMMTFERSNPMIYSDTITDLYVTYWDIDGLPHVVRPSNATFPHTIPAESTFVYEFPWEMVRIIQSFHIEVSCPSENRFVVSTKYPVGGMDDTYAVASSFTLKALSNTSLNFSFIRTT